MAYADVFRLRAGEMAVRRRGRGRRNAESARRGRARVRGGVFHRGPRLRHGERCRPTPRRDRGGLCPVPAAARPRDGPRTRSARRRFQITFGNEPSTRRHGSWIPEWESRGRRDIRGRIIASGDIQAIRRHAVDRSGHRAPRGRAEQRAAGQRLQTIRAYQMLAVLERMYRDGSARRWRSRGSARFASRSFVLLSSMLRSGPGHSVAAEDAVAGLFFPHAHDRLKTIFEARDLPSPASTRAAALKAIGRVNTVDAVEFVCDRLRDGDPAFADAARNAISRLTNPELVPVLRTQIELVPARPPVAPSRSRLDTSARGPRASGMRGLSAAAGPAARCSAPPRGARCPERSTARAGGRSLDIACRR